MEAHTEGSLSAKPGFAPFGSQATGQGLSAQHYPISRDREENQRLTHIHTHQDAQLRRMQVSDVALKKRNRGQQHLSFGSCLTLESIPQLLPNRVHIQRVTLKIKVSQLRKKSAKVMLLQRSAPETHLEHTMRFCRDPCFVRATSKSHTLRRPIYLLLIFCVPTPRL